MYESILPLLCCPVCQTSLTFDGIAQEGRLVSGDLRCQGCERNYPVEDEIPYLVDPESGASSWEWEVDISTADTFDAFDQAYTNSMPLVVRQARPLLLGRIVQIINQIGGLGPILDVATGRGVLLREMALLLTIDQPLLGIDMDSKVLRGTQRFLRRRGIYEPVSLAVMDAKHLALRSECMGTVTSWFGLNNVPDAIQALGEIRRVLLPGGELLSATLQVDQASASYRVAQEAGFGDFLTSGAVATSLKESDLTLDRVETLVEGVWPGNPYDAMPLKGDHFWHRLVIAHRP